MEQLRAKTETYIRNNNIGVPVVSWSVSFEQLSKSEEYKHFALLERVSLFDTVNVEFPALGVSATARAVKIVYDGLADRVKSVTLGSVRANIADTIANQSSAIEQNKTETRTQIQKAQEAATAWLTNGKGYAYFRKDDLGNIVDILFMDTQNAETAANVMRVGQSGIGFSHNGVNGPYESAWTIDGNFVADFITTGNLNASLIKTGVIKSNDGSIAIDLTNKQIIVQTLIDGANGKVVISRNGIDCYGWDENTGDYIRTISLWPGSRINGAETANSYLQTPNLNSGLIIGSHKFIRIGATSGLVYISDKETSWQYSNEFGKYVLCGE